MENTLDKIFEIGRDYKNAKFNLRQKWELKKPFWTNSMITTLQNHGIVDVLRLGDVFIGYSPSNQSYCLLDLSISKIKFIYGKDFPSIIKEIKIN